TDPFTYVAANNADGSHPFSQFTVANAAAPVRADGNGNTTVQLRQDASNHGDLYDGVAASVFVDHALLDVTAITGPSTNPVIPPVTLTATSLTGMTVGTVTFAALTALTVELPFNGSTLTVHDPPAGTTTSLRLFSTNLTVLGTTGPLSVHTDQNP